MLWSYGEPLMPKKNKAHLRAAMKLAPKDAVAYFRSKGYAITDQWQEMDGTAHSRAFTVAKAMRMDILEDVRAALDDALAEGITEREFINRLAPRLKEKGWWGKETWKDGQGNDREVQLGSVHRLKTIYRANVSSAYMAGRYRRQLAAVNERPYWMYVAVMDSRTRPSHSALNGKVFRWDDPIWQYIYPPNGWGCRCMVRNLTGQQVRTMGLTVESGASYIQMAQREAGVNRQTGEVITVEHPVINLPDGRTMSPDIGWGHNPGATAFGTDAGIAQKLGAIASADVRQQVIEDLNSSDLRREQFAQWVDRLAEGALPPRGRASASLLADDLAGAVESRLGVAPGRLQDVDASAIVGRVDRPGAIQALEIWRQIPTLLNRPKAVMWDIDQSALVYVVGPAGSGRVNAVLAPYNAVSGNSAALSSSLEGRVLSMADLLNSARYELIKGSLEGLL